MMLFCAYYKIINKFMKVNAFIVPNYQNAASFDWRVRSIFSEI